MIDLEKNVIVMFGEESEIKEWVVMFQTPVGLIQDVKQAREWCVANDCLPSHMLAPVAVAVDILGRFEIASGV